MMKHIFKTTLALLGTSLFFIGCSNEPAQDNAGKGVSLKFTHIPDQFSEIGVQHNRGVEYAFEAIKEHYRAATRSGEEVVKLNKEELLKIGDQAVLDFCAQNQNFGVDPVFIHTIFSLSKRESSSLSRAEVDGNNYSIELQNLLTELDAVLEKAFDNDEDQLKAELENLAAEAQSLLDETELRAFYAGVSTAWASLIYWTENYPKWEVALNDPELLLNYTDEELKNMFVDEQAITRGWIRRTWDRASGAVSHWWNYGGGKQVVGADAGGAASGALIGAGSAGAATGGAAILPGAYTGAIIGGCGASIQEGVSRWISR